MYNYKINSTNVPNIASLSIGQYEFKPSLPYLPYKVIYEFLPRDGNWASSLWLPNRQDSPAQDSSLLGSARKELLGPYSCQSLSIKL